MWKYSTSSLASTGENSANPRVRRYVRERERERECVSVCISFFFPFLLFNFCSYLAIHFPFVVVMVCIVMCSAHEKCVRGVAIDALTMEVYSGSADSTLKVSCGWVLVIFVEIA